MRPSEERLNQGNKYTFRPYINNNMSGGGGEHIKKFHLNKVDEINIKNIHRYDGSFSYRWFYGIYDSYNEKGWIKYHGLSKKEFFIEIGLKEEGFYDTIINTEKRVYTYFQKRTLWSDVKENTKFDNNTNDKLYDLINLYYYLASLGATSTFIHLIIPTAEKSWRGSMEESKTFFSQLLLLKELLKDANRDELKRCKHVNVDREYFEEYGYTPEEKYKERYNEMVDYLGKENKVLFYQENRILKEKLYEMKDFEERKKIIELKYKELFPNNNLKTND